MCLQDVYLCQACVMALPYPSAHNERVAVIDPQPATVHDAQSLVFNTPGVLGTSEASCATGGAAINIAWSDAIVRSGSATMACINILRRSQSIPWSRSIDDKETNT